MIILVGSEKGGTGKTTVAVNLAAACALSGQDVVMVDTDPQGSSSLWAETRSVIEVSPFINCVTKTGKIGYSVLDLATKYQHVIIDAGGRDNIELRQAMAVCDKMIIPMRASQFDSWTLDSMANSIRDIESRMEKSVEAYALLSAVPSNPLIREGEEMKKLLEEYAESFPLLQTILYDRIAYRRSARDGMSVLEISPEDAKAKLEVMSLFREAFS